MSFFENIANRAREIKSLLSVGLDPEISKIPEVIRSSKQPLLEFNKEIIDATYDLTLCYKIQFAHYAAEGREEELHSSIEYIKSKYPSIPVILDYKRGDIGNTAKYYAEEAFKRYQADAATYSPYMGFDSVEPLINYKDKGVFLLCKTSNKGSGDIQDLTVIDRETNTTMPLYKKLALTVQHSWNSNKNLGIVVGGTYPEILHEIRSIGIDLPILVPGIGAQGGDLDQVLEKGCSGQWTSLIISSSRGIIHKSSRENDFTSQARKEASNIKEKFAKYL